MRILIFRKTVATVFLGLALVVTGCQTGGGGGTSASSIPEQPREYVDSDLLRVGDLLKINFRGQSVQMESFEERVSETGTISLPFIGEVTAEGKSRVDLQKEIQTMYVPKYYKNLTVTIAPDQRFFYVEGEVNTSSRIPYAEEITVTRAIAAAGGFTDFANKRKVKLIRGDGSTEEVDYLRALEDPNRYDREVLPGDRIFVPIRIW